MTSTQSTRRAIAKLTIDEVVETLRCKGWYVRFYGTCETAPYVMYMVRDPELNGEAIRMEDGLRSLLAGEDKFFGPVR